jgi:ComF family protein
MEGTYATHIGKRIIRTLYPIECIGCACDTSQYLCKACLTSIPLRHSERAGPPPISMIVSAADTDAILLRKAVHGLKYQSLRAIATQLGDLMADALLGSPTHQALSPTHHPILVPIPLHRLRTFDRGYNQSELLGRQISKRTGYPQREMLRRTRWTGTQVELTGEERLANVADAFVLKKNTRIPKNATIILIDDVLTTGATLAAAARALAPTNPQNIIALTLLSAKR